MPGWSVQEENMANAAQKAQSDSFDAVVVGAGFAGMYMLYRLRELGFATRVYEAGDGVGGTWYWNRYPGARCDIPSIEYSFQFDEALQQEWEWSEKYATQAEILRYANHVAERFNLLPDIQFNTRISSARFDEDAKLWQVRLPDGELVRARYVVMATGCLSVPNFPSIKGLDTFSGEVVHTGLWPHEGVSVKDKRVAVIGTGSSAIQSVPLLAQQASELTVFQRTPNYSIPAHNAPHDPDEIARLKQHYAEFRADNWTRGFGANFRDNERGAFEVDDTERLAEYEDRWARGGLAFLAAFSDLVFDDKANATAREFFKNKIAEVVADPELAAKLTPSTPIGCKRLCVDTDYYQTFNQPHVSLVDLNTSPITQVTAHAVTTADGSYPVDVIVLATGFDAMTGAVTRIEIEGRNGQRLSDKWAHGPKAYLGLATAGFPNLFLITGPGSPSVLSNMLPSIEHHVEWVADCIAYLRDNQHQVIDVDGQAEQAWVDHVNEVAGTSIYPNCNSWYLGANVEGKERVFMPYLGVPPYREKCAAVVANEYDGFLLA
jgi:cyclohexanone monooxygenase